jgi:hypothetical protein
MFFIPSLFSCVIARSKKPNTNFHKNSKLWQGM